MAQVKSQPSNALQLLLWTGLNTFATIGIVFTNKAIFRDPQLRLNQSSFAAFHFLVTACTLYAISRPPFSLFQPRRIKLRDMIPLVCTMCLNVILPNLSLAYSSITFYQIARILLTPTVALINFFCYGTVIPSRAALTLVPICAGVGLVTYYDTQTARGSAVATTSSIGILFAFAGVIASSLYTVWVGSYQKNLGVNSMQLLLNQAPLSAFALLYVIPFTDHAPDWLSVEASRYYMILLSGMFASMINITQFFIIAGAGAVTSTVVGHLKTCSIVMLGWAVSGRKATDKSILGIILALGGIISYSVIMYRPKQQSMSKV